MSGRSNPGPRVSLAGATLILTGLAIVCTWPIAGQLGGGVSDFGDPMLNAWALGWIAHALPSNPADLLDGNVFHPERGTLAYSELLLLPAMATAPLIWLGSDPILAHNLLLLAGYAISGVTMFLLTRRLTGHEGAALVGAAIFALYPYRIDQFAHVQLQLIMWWPLALLLFHDLVRMPTWRRAVALGATAAAQLYTCVYWAVFGSVVIAVIGAALLLMTRPPRQTWTALLLALAVAGVLSLPAGAIYGAASRSVGERTLDVAAGGSATLRDYASASPEHALYGDDRRPGEWERHLFPGFTTPTLAAVSLFAPAAVPLSYAIGGLAAFDLSLGVNAPGYATLFAWVRPFRALRMPARFGMLVGLCLSVLASFGVLRLCRGRSAGVQWGLVAVLLACVTVESRMRPVEVSALPDSSPAVYTWLAGERNAIVCEYPLGNLEGRIGPQDPTYMYYSTRHWKPIVNGYSGYFPAWWDEFRDALTGFPDDRAIDALRRRGVTHLLVHSVFYIRGSYAADVAALTARGDLVLAGRFRWANGGESAFRLR